MNSDPGRVDNNINSILECFSNIAEAIIVEGSWAYGSANKNSDLDIEIIINNFDQLMFLNKISKDNSIKPLYEGLEKSIKLFKNNKHMQLIQSKRIINKISTGIRLTPRNVFENICNTNLNYLNINSYLLSVRDGRGKNEKLHYFQRNFNGGKHKFNKYFYSKDDIQLAFVPVFLFDDKKNFYPGSMVDRYLCLPKIIYSKSNFIYGNLKNLYKNILNRYYMELGSGMLSRTSGINLCLCRWQNLSRSAKKDVIEMLTYNNK